MGIPKGDNGVAIVELVGLKPLTRVRSATPWPSVNLKLYIRETRTLYPLLPRSPWQPPSYFLSPWLDYSSEIRLFTFMHWRRKWQATPVFLPGESQGRESLVGYRLWGRTGLDTTERLHFHFSLSCIGEGNGNPLQCSCLENPRDGGAWWAAAYGVA